MNHSPSGIATSQVTVTTSATQLVTKDTVTTEVLIINEGTTAVRIGGSAVTSGTGALLPGAVGATLSLTFSGDLYGITASGSQAVSVIKLSR